MTRAPCPRERWKSVLAEKITGGYEIGKLGTVREGAGGVRETPVVIHKLRVSGLLKSATLLASKSRCTMTGTGLARCARLASSVRVGGVITQRSCSVSSQGNRQTL
ncbi:MAG: hypothetical protein U1G07_27295 [Verrucomicrobiota bacterium]